MGAEFLARRALGVEAVEDRLQLVRRNAGALVVDRDEHAAAVAPGGEADAAAAAG